MLCAYTISSWFYYLEIASSFHQTPQTHTHTSTKKSTKNQTIIIQYNTEKPSEISHIIMNRQQAAYTKKETIVFYVFFGMKIKKAYKRATIPELCHYILKERK